MSTSYELEPSVATQTNTDKLQKVSFCVNCFSSVFRNCRTSWKLHQTWGVWHLVTLALTKRMIPACHQQLSLMEPIFQETQTVTFVLTSLCCSWSWFFTKHVQCSAVDDSGHTGVCGSRSWQCSAVCFCSQLCSGFTACFYIRWSDEYTLLCSMSPTGWSQISTGN